MTATLSSKGQIVLPSSYRQLDHLHAGESFELERLDSGKYLLTRKNPPPNSGFVDLLIACPEADWFQPVSSDSTDVL